MMLIHEKYRSVVEKFAARGKGCKVTCIR